MTTFDRSFWEERWSHVLREHADRVADRAPNAHRQRPPPRPRPSTEREPGGTLFLVGHRPIDPATGAATAAAGQVQVCIDTAVAALDPGRWRVILAENRPRTTAGTGVDAVICAKKPLKSRPDRRRALPRCVLATRHRAETGERGVHTARWPRAFINMARCTSPTAPRKTHTAPNRWRAPAANHNVHARSHPDRTPL